jgi:glutamine synthetase
MNYTKTRNNLLDIYIDCKTALDRHFADDCFFKIGLEIEFYLAPKADYDFLAIIDPIDFPYGDILKISDIKVKYFYELLLKKLSPYKYEIGDIEPEDGSGQFEITINSLLHPVVAAEAIARFKKFATEAAKELDLVFIPSAKPFKNQAASGLQVNISMFNSSGLNLFVKNGYFSEILYFSIAGIISRLSEMIYLCCLEDENAYLRYRKPEFGDININYPTNISWGINNRTCAIRVPYSKSMNPDLFRIELRFPSVSCEPFQMISGMIFAITEGILGNKKPIEPLYYNAFDERYDDIKKLPKNKLDAFANFHGRVIYDVLNFGVKNRLEQKSLTK